MPPTQLRANIAYFAIFDILYWRIDTAGLHANNVYVEWVSGLYGFAIAWFKVMNLNWYWRTSSRSHGDSVEGVSGNKTEVNMTSRLYARLHCAADTHTHTHIVYNIYIRIWHTRTIKCQTSCKTSKTWC